MTLFDVFLIAAVGLAAAAGGFFAWMAARRRRSRRIGHSLSPREKVFADWRVYALDKDGNCFSGAEILLGNARDEFLIGRQQSCGLRLMKPEIGRRHAKVTRKGIVYTYTDLGSHAGSVCGHERISEKRLEHMMVVWVYDVALVFANCETAAELLAQAVLRD